LKLRSNLQFAIVVNISPLVSGQHWREAFFKAPGIVELWWNLELARAVDVADLTVDGHRQQRGTAASQQENQGKYQHERPGPNPDKLPVIEPVHKPNRPMDSARCRWNRLVNLIGVRGRLRVIFHNSISGDRSLQFEFQ